jgi:hypothetical protein
MANVLTQERLKTVLTYDEKTGIFYWNQDLCQGRIKKGSIAGGTANTRVSYIGVDRKMYPAARLAWLYMYGEFPKNHIRKLDGNANNIAKDNLTLVLKTKREFVYIDNSNNIAKLW